jgi:hypothetical protein
VTQRCDHGMFSLYFLREVLSTLRDNRSVAFITASEVFTRYPELSPFTALRAQHGPNKTLVALQHDVDDLPERTMNVVKLEIALGIRSTIYLFAHWVPNRWSERLDDPYVVDHKFLRHAQDAGFEIGYHQNAYERAGYDSGKAHELFISDIAELSRHYDIRTFVPHGGYWNEQRTLNNFSLAQPPPQCVNLFWFSNSGGREPSNGKPIPQFHRKFSDGLRRHNPEPAKEFIKKMEGGKNYLMLFHPQYYP